ncbi:MAG: ATP-binding protein [Planctomycetota bacterium]
MLNDPHSTAVLGLTLTEAWRSLAAVSGLVGIIGGGVAAIAAWALARRERLRAAVALRQMHRYIEVRREDADATPPNLDAEHRDIIDAIGRVTGDAIEDVRVARQTARSCEIELGLARAELRYLEAVLHAISDAVLVTDAFNEVAVANRAAADALTFELDGAGHRPIDQIVRDTQLATMIKDTRDSGDTSLRRRIEKRLPTPGGGERVFDVTVTSLAEQEKERAGVNGVVTVLRDVTREREIAASKSHFVSSVSHELRTPLSSIAAYVEMLVDGEARDAETRDEFYGIIQAETTRLARLIDNILNINRIESGIMRAQRERLVLGPIIREAIDVMRPQAEAKRIELEDHVSPLQDHVFADRDMMFQVVLNLVGNAVKYTEAGGVVKVSSDSDRSGRLLSVSVKDSGVGIPEDALPHVFDKFYRVQGHQKMATGTGLGLNLVKHVVETVHDGTIRVTSKLNEGSTFTFELPFADNS